MKIILFIGVRDMVLTLLLCFCFTAYSYAGGTVLERNFEIVLQQKTILGVVTDENKQPMIGVSVVEKGTQNSVVTGSNGDFSMSVTNPDAVLVINYSGYKSLEIVVGTQGNVKISMQPDQPDNNKALEEVVLTGYATQSKESITGSVSVVNVNSLVNMPDGNAIRTLQGRVTGIQIGKTGGPGGENTVRIRGYSNVSTNDPLYIIDGTPTQDGTIFNAINPADIESMQVLKDAASAAIYGSRANNGVIIISTKSGAKVPTGKTEVNLSYSTGLQTPRKEAFPSFLSPAEYGDWLWERQKNGGNSSPASRIYGNGSVPVIPDYFIRTGTANDLNSAGTYDIALNAIKKANASGTNWLDEITRQSLYHNVNVSVAKSTDKSSAYFSVGYYKNDGIIKYTSFDRFSVRINTSFKATDFITLGENLTVAYSDLSGQAVNQNETGPIFMAMRINPILPVYDVAGNFAGTSGQDLGNAHNPLALLYRKKDDHSKTLNVLGNVYAQLDFSKWVKGLGAEVRINMDYTGINLTDYTGKSLERSEPQIRAFFREGNSYNINQTYTGLIKYNNTFGKSQITALVGVEAIHQTYRMSNATRYGYISDNINFRYLDAGGPVSQLNGGNGNQVGLSSFFFKGDYVFNRKYFVTGILRNDASSRFLASNRSRLFPSLGVGWQMSKESFLENVEFLDNLKLRASWGQTGNQSTSLSYPAYTLYTLNSRNNDYDIGGTSNSAQIGLTPYQDGNHDLRWEVVSSLDVGVEASFFGNKLTFEGGYYHKQTNDMLVQVPRPGTQGLALNPWQNVGTMLNEGVELAVNYNNTLGNGIKYSVGVNFSRNVNTVVKLLDNDQAFIPGRQFRANTITRISQGRPISYFYGYVVDDQHPFYTSQAEIDQTKQPTGVVGGFRYKDINGDGVVNADDRTMIGIPFTRLYIWD